MYRHFSCLRVGGNTMDEYRTVKQEAAGFLEVKRSKFHCYACPVKSQDEANDFIQKIRSKHWDARHNVPAYVIRNGNMQHFSDDGEPSGTAGRPVLDVLTGQQVTDVCVVITRYFGGVLLGTGGLVRAYSEGAQRALDAAGIITMRRMTRCELQLDYSLYGRFPSLLADNDGLLENTDFGSDVSLQFLLPAGTVDAFNRQLADVSAGKYAARAIEDLYVEQ